MIDATAIVVDSAAYLPAAVTERYGLITVPLTVIVDGQEFREYVDLDGPTFYRRLAEGATVSTSQPSPGRFIEAYEAAAAAGAQRIVSIHIGSAISGTVNSARLASASSPVPVHVIDTGQASFIEGLCAWEAIEALAAGATIEEAEAAAHRAAAAVGNVFIVRGLELLKQGGRMLEAPAPPDSAPPVPVLALVDGAIRPIGSPASIDDALEAMVAHVTKAVEANPGKSFRTGISNGAADELAALLEARVRAIPQMDEVMQYEIGPVVGAHTGPGCTGAVFLPRPV
ncbi:MAG: DegV family protein [Tepidiformaceae bacterium]